MEEHLGIKADPRRIPASVPAGLHCHEIETRQAGPLGLPPPAVGGAGRVGQLIGPIDDEHGPAVDPDRPGIAKRFQQPADVGEVVVRGIALRLEQISIGAVPTPRPGLVGPAEAEGEVGLTAGQNFGEGAFQKSLALKPVVVVAESMDAVFTSEVGLCLSRFGRPQVVEAEIGRQLGLIVTMKEGLGFADVPPFGEPAAPPGIVLGNRMKLRQMEGDQPGS